MYCPIVFLFFFYCMVLSYWFHRSNRIFVNSPRADELCLHETSLKIFVAIMHYELANVVIRWFFAKTRCWKIYARNPKFEIFRNFSHGRRHINVERHKPGPNRISWYVTIRVSRARRGRNEKPMKRKIKAAGNISAAGRPLCNAGDLTFCRAMHELNQICQTWNRSFRGFCSAGIETYCHVLR